MELKTPIKSLKKKSSKISNSMRTNNRKLLLLISTKLYYIASGSELWRVPFLRRFRTYMTNDEVQDLHAKEAETDDP